MKNLLQLLTSNVVAVILLFAVSINLNAQSVQDILNEKSFSVDFNQTRSDEILLTFTLDDYDFNVVEKDGMSFTEIVFNHGAITEKAGYAELPVINANLMLDTDYDVTVSVDETDYIDIQLDYPIIPSRGVIYRNQDPNEIPYNISPESIVDEFYPTELAFNEDPFILRDVRGVNIYAHPFRYNAEKKVLRVYKTLVVTVHEDMSKTTNPLTISPDYVTPAMNSIYESLFINYAPERFTNELGEHGEMLVIYTSRDVDAIQPYITWKKEKGYVVHTMEVAAGTNVKSTIQNAYDANPNIFYVQLVGGWDEIKTDTENLAGNTTAPMDPMLGCVVGTDFYPDIIIGRFSARTTENVTTHVNKSIDYMMNPDTGASGDWYTKAVGMARNEGDGGGHHGGEADYVHMDIVRDKLFSYNYTTVYREYDGNVPGVTNTTATQISSRINDGISVLNFCNHGYETGWSVGSYSNTHVNALTNGNKLPFIWSVACLVGKFNYSSDCFAETWLNKSGGGAVAFLGATINQPWQPPMTGQDYFNDLLIGGYNYDTGDGGDGNSTNTTAANKRTTFGALSFNGMILMLSDSYGTASYQETMKTWTLFGDASVQVRTDTPVDMAISHDPDVILGSAVFDVTCDTEGAWGTLTRDGNLIGTAFASGGSIAITIDEEIMVGDVLKLVVTAYNKVPYVVNLNVIAAGAYANFTADQTNILLGESVTFTDTSDPDGGSFSSYSWDFGAGADPATATGIGPHTVTYNTAGSKTVSLTATHSTDGDLERIKENYITVNDIFTLTINTNGSGVVEVDGVEYTGPMDLAENSSVSLEAIPANQWNFDGWSGDLTSYNNPANLVIDADKSVTVNFLDCSSVAIPFEENFDASAELPVCWEIIDHQGNGQVWEIGTHTSGLTGTTGNYAYLNSDDFGSGNTQNTDLVTPTFDFTAYTDINLSFTHYYRHYTGSAATVSYSIDNGATWTQIQQWAANTANPETFSEIIADAAGEAQVKFKWNFNGTWGYYWDIDDINITGTASGTYANFTASPTTVFPGETVTFTDASSGDATSWSWDFGADATPATATGQGPHDVTYSALGNKTVSLTVNGDVTNTKADYISVIEEVTYPTTLYENFQDFTDFTTDLSLNGWTTIDVLNQPTYGSTDYDFPGENDPFAYMVWNPAQLVPASTTDLPVDGDKYAVSIQTTGSVVDDKWLISPKLTGTASSSLSFYVRSITADYGLERFKVLVSTTDTQMSSFTQINAGDYLEAPVDWTLFEFDLAPYVDGELYHFAIQRVSDDAFIMMLDAINVEAEADFLLGDINQDGFINVLDVVLMVNIIVGNEFDPIADMDGSTVIDAIDLTMLVDLIMGGVKSPVGINSEAAYISIVDDNVVFESDGTLTALQFKLSADNANEIDLQLIDNSYNFSYAVKDNMITGLMYSLDNTILPEEAAEIIKVSNADNSLKWEEVFAVNTDYERVEVISKDATSIEDIDFSNLNVDLYPNPSKGNFTVSIDLPSDALLDLRMYDASGREVMNVSSALYTMGSNKIDVNVDEKVNSGFYILNITAFDSADNKLLFTKKIKVLIEN